MPIGVYKRKPNKDTSYQRSFQLVIAARAQKPACTTSGKATVAATGFAAWLVAAIVRRIPTLTPRNFTTLTIFKSITAALPLTKRC